MKLKILSIFLTLMIYQINSQENNNEQKIKDVIYTFFDGLHQGDSAKISSTLYKDLKIQTTSTNKEGLKVLSNQEKKAFLTSIANKKPEQIFFEKLLSMDVKIDGNLASVWTPYEFYYNNQFSHCGANSFQLFDDNGTWKIIYLVDMRRRGDCAALQTKK